MFDRFEYDTGDSEPAAAGTCTHERCQQVIYVGERHWDYDGEWFCSAACLARYIGAEKRIVETMD